MANLSNADGESADCRHASSWCGADAKRLLLLTALVVGAFAICVTSVQAHSDDYWLLWLWRHDPAEVARLHMVQGRPLTAWLWHIGWQELQSTGDLWQPRLLSAIGVGLLSLAIYVSLRRLGYMPDFALAVAAAAALLPTFAVYASWAVCWLYPYACLTALAAFWITESAGGHWLWLRAGFALPAVGALAAAFCIYQPAALFYVVPLMFLVASDRWTNLPKREVLILAIHVLVLLAAIGAAALVYQALAENLQELAAARRATFTRDPVWKIGRFILQPLGQSSVLFFFLNDWSKPEMAGILVPIFGIWIPWGLYLRFGGTPAARGIRVALLLALVPLSYLPNLLIASDDFAYRTRPGIAVAVLFLLVASTSGILRHFVVDRERRAHVACGGIIAAIATGFLLFQHHVAEFYLIPTQLECTVIRSEVLRELRREPMPQKVVFVMARHKQPVATRFIYYEMGYASSSLPWTCEGMVGLALVELAPEQLPTFERAEFVRVPEGETPPAPEPGVWIIDARLVNQAGSSEASNPAGHQ